MIHIGTGSGSLTHAMAFRVKPSGHIYTYDFHEQRAEQAQKEFESHQLSHIVTSQCRYFTFFQCIQNVDVKVVLNSL